MGKLGKFAAILGLGAVAGMFGGALLGLGLAGLGIATATGATTGIVSAAVTTYGIYGGLAGAALGGLKGAVDLMTGTGGQEPEPTQIAGKATKQGRSAEITPSMEPAIQPPATPEQTTGRSAQMR